MEGSRDNFVLWNDIETAPYGSGRRILISFHGRVVVGQAYLFEGGEKILANDAMMNINGADHWSELPKAPTTEASHVQ